LSYLRRRSLAAYERDAISEKNEALKPLTRVRASITVPLCHACFVPDLGVFSFRADRQLTSPLVGQSMRCRSELFAPLVKEAV
jgi:hypothetical protein